MAQSPSQPSRPVRVKEKLVAELEVLKSDDLWVGRLQREQGACAHVSNAKLLPPSPPSPR